MPTTIVIDGVTLTLKKYPEFTPGTPIATDITLFSDPVNGDLFKTTMDNLIANILNVDGVTITGDGSSGSPLVAVTGGGAITTADNGLLIDTPGNVQWGDVNLPGAPLLHATNIDNNGFDFFMHGTGQQTFRTADTDFQSNVATSLNAVALTTARTSTNLFSEVNAADAGISSLTGGNNTTFYNTISVTPTAITLITQVNTTPTGVNLATNGALTFYAYGAGSITGTAKKSLQVNSSGDVIEGPAFVLFTPSNSTDNTYPNGTLTADNTFLYYRGSGGTWVKVAWIAF